jgi:2-isopropylmalate synthase
MIMFRKIAIFDTTLRDGEQSPGCSMNLQEKVVMAKQLEKLGVSVIEAGFPIASQGEFEAVQAVCDVVENATIAALCRAKTADIDRAWAAIKHAKRKRIHTFIATSDIHLHHKLKMNRSEVLQAVREMVQHARSYCEDVEFSAEDASRTEISFLVDVAAVAIEAGATTINLPDTVGYATPKDYGNIFAEIIRQLPQSRDISLSAHCHNDLGLAVANSLAAIENGATQVECTVNGIGERAGNASLEEIVMALFVRKEMFQVECDVNTREIYPTSRLLSGITGVPVQPNKAVVGKNAFAHEAGIHQDGVLKNALTYEIMTPESVGLDRNNIVLGKHSGRHALKKRCQELGVDLPEPDLQKVYEAFLKVADKKKVVETKDIQAILRRGGWIFAPSYTDERLAR